MFAGVTNEGKGRARAGDNGDPWRHQGAQAVRLGGILHGQDRRPQGQGDQIPQDHAGWQTL